MILPSLVMVLYYSAFVGLVARRPGRDPPIPLAPRHVGSSGACIVMNFDRLQPMCVHVFTLDIHFRLPLVSLEAMPLRLPKYLVYTTLLSVKMSACFVQWNASLDNSTIRGRFH